MWASIVAVLAIAASTHANIAAANSSQASRTLGGMNATEEEWTEAREVAKTHFTLVPREQLCAACETVVGGLQRRRATMPMSQSRHPEDQLLNGLCNSHSDLREHKFSQPMMTALVCAPRAVASDPRAYNSRVHPKSLFKAPASLPVALMHVAP